MPLSRPVRSATSGFAANPPGATKHRQVRPPIDCFDHLEENEGESEEDQGTLALQKTGKGNGIKGKSLIVANKATGQQISPTRLQKGKGKARGVKGKAKAIAGTADGKPGHRSFECP